MEWLKTAISPLEKLIAFLQQKSKTQDVIKKQIITELRDNLNVFKNGFINDIPLDNMIDLLSNSAIRQGVKENFNFKKLQHGEITIHHVKEERNKRYIGWTAAKLCDKIDEKIQEIKLLKQMNNGTVNNLKSKVSLKMSNLYFRLKLLGDFIWSDPN